MTRVAVVTGANKGIGYAITKGLYQQFDGIVYLTARNEALGKSAVEKIISEVPTKSKLCQDLRYHQLDISNSESIQNLKNYIGNQHGRLDILINNAGMAYKVSATEPFGEQAENSIAINYTGTKRVCEALFPILNSDARVVNVSSTSGLFQKIADEHITKKLVSTDLTVADIDGILNDFVRYAKEGTHGKHGFPNTAYGMSKVGLTALTFVQQRQFDKDGRGILINACCPGYVNTDMSSGKGHLTPDEGAITPLYLALLPKGTVEPRGKFLREKRVLDPVNGQPV